MAARTSSSFGVGVLVTVLGIATLGLFVTTVIMWSSASNMRKQLTDLEQNTAEFIRSDERNTDAVARLKEPARRSNKSVTGYLITTQGEIMKRVTGNPGDSVEAITRKLDEASSPNLLALVRSQEGEVASLKSQLADAIAAKERALQDKENEAKRVQSIDENMKTTLAAQTAELDRYKGEVDELRRSIDEYRAKADERVTRIRDDAAGRERELGSTIDELQRESVLNRSLIQRLQDELKGKRYTGKSEFALVDAEIIALNPADGTAVINIGRQNKLTIGMPFAVYSDATAIRPNEQTGEYPEGKASVEVIRMDDQTATVRILREKRGNPLVRGDVLANAVYDPNKEYAFVLYGTFDYNRDGRATTQELDGWRAKINSWGGRVLDDLTGEVDFLVLGDRPVLPPEPASTAPVEVVDEWLRLQRAARRYDELFKKATETSIPVLNENRLRTLIGDLY